MEGEAVPSRGLSQRHSVQEIPFLCLYRNLYLNGSSAESVGKSSAHSTTANDQVVGRSVNDYECDDVFDEVWEKREAHTSSRSSSLPSSKRFVGAILIR